MTFFILILELTVFTFVLICLSIVLGQYMATIFTENEYTFLKPLKKVEQFCYKMASINPSIEMNAKTYIKEMIKFNFLGFLAVFFLMLFQKFLPLNPENFIGNSFDVSFNTASSFVTNTNWQSYIPEQSVSYLTQMLGLTVQNFLSTSTGLSVLIALTRGITRKETKTIGNFYVDLVKSIVYLFLPLSILLSVILLTQGTIQNFLPYVKISTLEGASQIIPMGPATSQVAIKQLGTNGGGFFNANSAHPFSNPTPLSNFLQTLSILLIPSASIYCYGLMTGMRKHATVIYAVTFFLFFIGFICCLYGEYIYGQNIGIYPVMEGKETRLGLINSLLWSTATTATSSGSINAMITSLSPLSGGVTLFNMMVDELIFGGVGVGLCSLIMFILMTVFIGGLMVGRTPEYMGKKIEVVEMQWITVAILAPAALILIGSGISSILPIATNELDNTGPHGLSTILYAFSSSAGNNGSAFTNLNANTPYYNIFLGMTMLIARLSILIPSLMIAGFLAEKKISPPSLGTFSTNSSIFALLLFAVILLGGALTFLPALALGPLAEHFLMQEGRFF